MVVVCRGGTGSLPYNYRSGLPSAFYIDGMPLLQLKVTRPGRAAFISRNWRQRILKNHLRRTRWLRARCRRGFVYGADYRCTEIR